jgi:hypothetical protein
MPEPSVACNFTSGFNLTFYGETGGIRTLASVRPVQRTKNSKNEAAGTSSSLKQAFGKPEGGRQQMKQEQAFVQLSPARLRSLVVYSGYFGYFGPAKIFRPAARCQISLVKTGQIAMISASVRKNDLSTMVNPQVNSVQ